MSDTHDNPVASSSSLNFSPSAFSTPAPRNNIRIPKIIPLSASPHLQHQQQQPPEEQQSPSPPRSNTVTSLSSAHTMSSSPDHDTQQSAPTPLPALPDNGGGALDVDTSLPSPAASTTAPQQDLAKLAQGLAGKYVDEFGNILDWDGTVLGRAEGDLPSMVGRPVSSTGQILDVQGEVVGQVSENYIQLEQQQAQAEEEAKQGARPSLRPLAGELKTDEQGNIYNGQGQVIGKLNEEMIMAEEEKRKAEEKEQQQQQQSPQGAATPSPSEVYLDVKSTHDGIQLIIKIPTVFNRGGPNP